MEDSDQIRLDSIKEAKPRLAKMLAAFEKEIETVDSQLKEERKSVEEERKKTMAGFLEGLHDPQLQTVS